MPFNGSGVFQRVRNWVADAAAGIKIRADYHDAEDDGFAAGLTNCITKDGQTVITQNIPLNSKRITGLADPVNAQDAATKNYTDTKIAAGGVFTGDLTIKKDGPQLILDDTDDTGDSIIGQHKDKNRWVMHLGNATAETGTGNVGSDFDLLPFADDGLTGLGTALLFSRATGLGVVKGDPTDLLGIMTKQYTDTKDAALQTAIDTKQANLGFTPVRQGGGPSQTGDQINIGWSGGGLRASVNNGDLGLFLFAGSTAYVNDGRLAYAGDIAVATGPQGNMYEPYAGAMITGWSWVIAGGVATTGSYRFRYMQLHTSAWYTVGYA